MTDHAGRILDRQSIADEYGKADTSCQTLVGSLTSSTSATSMARSPRPRVVQCALWFLSTPRTLAPDELWVEHVGRRAALIEAQGLNGLDRVP